MNSENQDEQSKFFEQWNIYQSVIKNNYMFHAQIIDILKTEVDYLNSPSILDLGCGDSYVVKKILDEKVKIHYTGIDSSSMAIQSSKNNLCHFKGEVSHIQGDFLEELRKIETTFDMIISGYSLHHLSREYKEEFFSLISNVISDNGIFIFYDIELNQNETIVDFLNRACEIFSNEWDVFNTNEIEKIVGHVQQSDIPESEEFYINNITKAGVLSSRKVFEDKNDLFALYVSRNNF